MTHSINTERESDSLQKEATFTATVAARECRVARSTIMRALKQNKIIGAQKDHNNNWVIPLSGLLAAGYVPGKSTPEKENKIGKEAENNMERESDSLQKLATELAIEKSKRESLERIIEEKDKHISDMRLSLKMIEAGSTRTKNQKKRWWSRGE